MILVKKFKEAKRLRPYKTCAMMLDIRGRQIKMGKCKNPEGIKFKSGEVFEMRCDDINIPSTNKIIQVDNRSIFAGLREGDLVFFGVNGQFVAEFIELTGSRYSANFKMGT
jgi:pyruvate kinase